jgi:hypothetical protein
MRRIVRLMKSETIGAYAALLVGTTVAFTALVAYGLLENQSEGFVYAKLTQQQTLCGQLSETLKVERDVIRETMSMYREEIDKRKDLNKKYSQKCIDLSSYQRAVRSLQLSTAYAHAWNVQLKKQLTDAGIEPVKRPPYVIMKGKENDGNSNGGGDTPKGVPSTRAPLSNE